MNKQYIISSVVILSVGIIALWVFTPALQFGFTNWDDNYLITQNTKIRDLSFNNILKIFSSFSLNHYHPLVDLSYALELKIFGLNPYHFHLTNIFLHAINSILVVLLVIFLTKNNIIALVAGLLFAIHPLRVESVVWIAERKDVLSAFFTLLSLIFYIRYKQVKKKQIYTLMLCSFIAALLSKAMAIMIPVLFLLFDYYIDGKVSAKNLKEKIPLFLLSFLFGVIAIVAQYEIDTSSIFPPFSIWKSSFHVSYGLLFYIFKYFVPFGLSPVYPYPETIGANYPLVFWLSPLIVAVCAFGIYFFLKNNRLLIVAFLFYIIAILPVLQFIPVGRTMTADRFSYIPLIGIMIATGWCYDILWKHINKNIFRKILLLTIELSIVGGLIILTRQQISIWETSTTLWRRVIYDNPNYAEGYNNLGLSLAEEGNIEGALQNFNRAIVLDSTEVNYFYNRGLLFLQLKQWENAIQDFSRMISINPNDINGYRLRGKAYLSNKLYRESISDFNYILDISPFDSDIRIERIKAFYHLCDYVRAQEDITFLRFAGIPIDSALVNEVESHIKLKQVSRH